jgi:hypothetical protein
MITGEVDVYAGGSSESMASAVSGADIGLFGTLTPLCLSVDGCLRDKQA